MSDEIRAEELAQLPAEKYVVIDIRDPAAFEYGHINDSVNIPQDKVLDSELPADKTLIICCKSGIISSDIADQLRERGFDAVNLAGGYAACGPSNRRGSAVSPMSLVWALGCISEQISCCF